MYKRKNLRDVNVSQRMHDRVKHVVDKDHADNSACGLRVFRHCVVCTRACPAREDSGHSDECDHVLRAAIKLLREKGAGHARNEVPAGQAKVDLVLFAAICDADGS